ncbi:unannotated protein [freshwater metagenome]|uniref:Unannotated protein n=1 Tax=freshwater metagenome TaxID=449393 RepID=A0A6J7DVN8_9ZZZZ
MPRSSWSGFTRSGPDTSPMVPLLPGSEPIGLPAGANDVERAPACTGESEPRPLSPSVLPAQACPRPRLPSPRRWFGSVGRLAHDRQRMDVLAARDVRRRTRRPVVGGRGRSTPRRTSVSAAVKVGLGGPDGGCRDRCDPRRNSSRAASVSSERRMAGSRGRLSDGDGPRARRSHDDRFPHPKAEGRVLRTRSRDL